MRRALLTVMLTATAVLAAPAAAQAQGCITTLPVSHSFKSPYAAAFGGKALRVRVASQGSWIHHAKAELYTFDGLQIARSNLRRGGFNRTRTFEMRLRYGALQAGKYTLVVTGEPNQNRSCGPKKYVQVVEFKACPKSLPVGFPDPPAGNASDYEGWLSLNLRSRGGLLRNVQVDVFDFDNVQFASGTIRALYGTARLDMKLKQKLVDGGYTVVVNARGAVPRRCGRVQATKVLHFGPQPATGKSGSGTTTGSGGTQQELGDADFHDDADTYDDEDLYDEGYSGEWGGDGEGGDGAFEARR